MVKIREENKKGGIYTDLKPIRGRSALYLVILLVALVLFFILKPDTLKKPGGSGQESEQVQSSGPVFEKEGVLTFLKPDSTKIVTIDIEIADDDAQRERGLMYRKQMEMSTGMLFIFEDQDYRSFWMKNTYIPLDIIYLDANRKIVRIHENVATLNEQSVPSDFPAKYVVEVIAGFTALYSITTGDMITFSR
jgi:uncharacterized membrane protein (UPF0127 family)